MLEIYATIALIFIFIFYRRFLLSLFDDMKETLQMLFIIALIAIFVYLVCDYVLDVVPNNIRNTRQVIPLTEYSDVSNRA